MCGYFCIGFIDFMLAGKKIDCFYKHVFSSWLCKNWWYYFYLCQRWMNVILLKLIKQTWLTLDKITEIENHRKSCSKKLSKYVTAFDYIDKILIVLSAITGVVSICSFTSLVGAPVGIASASFTLFLSLSTRIVKNLLSITRNKKKKHDKNLMLAKMGYV